MSDDFRSFSSLLLGRTAVAEDVPPAACDAPEPSVERDDAAADGTSRRNSDADPRVADLLAGFAVELTRLTARAAELLEERAEAVLADLAHRVLGRELHSSPAEIATLLAQTVAEFAVTEPLVVRVSGADAERFVSPWSVHIDPALGAGDLAVDVEDGTFDLKLQTRLEAMLASHCICL
jgi:flagellar biosynthesis/type III secretory pathway protein FliH